MSILRSFLTGISVITLIGPNSLAKSIIDPIKNYLPLHENDPIRGLSYGELFPTNYKITLAPDFDVRNFIGKSSINITVSAKSPVKTIILHAKDLIFDENFTYLYNGDHTFKPLKHTIDQDKNYLTLTFSPLIVNGNYSLNFMYSGKLNDDFNGFYRTSYLSEENKSIKLAATNFKSNRARQAFPCFDEPSLRSTFEILINHWTNYTAISNVRVKNLIPDVKNNKKVYTIFEKTPPIAPYQVAFVISNLKKISNKNDKFNIWARKDLSKMSKYALEVGQKELELLEKYTGVNSGVQKIDNVVVPNLGADAIENWGLITFSERSLLLDEKDTSTDIKQNVAMLMSQKLTNQWFGNLVTPLSWNDWWINEGLANYFQYMITDQAEPNWRLMDQFVIKNLQEKAFVADDDETQHAINQNQTNIREIELFDIISSSKTGCVLRMFSHVFDELIFQIGLRQYLRRTKYGTGSKSYLFNALISAAKDLIVDVPLEEFLTTWSDQSGYPVITATRNYRSGIIDFKQKRYLSEKTRFEDSPESWWIPLNSATQNDPKFDDTKPELWLGPNSSMSTKQFKPKNDQWIIFNNKQTGYYRVNYDRTNWNLISDYLQTKNYKKINVINRAQLLDDSFNLVSSKDLNDYEVFLSISSYLKQEDDYVPWYAAFRAIEVFDNCLVNSKKYDLFKLYILRLLNKLEMTIGYYETDKDDHLTKLNRINLIKWSSKMGSEKCNKVTHKRLIEHLAGTSKISADLRSAVLCAGIRAGNETIWKKAFEAYEASRDENERHVILEALACSADKKIIYSYVANYWYLTLDIHKNDVIKAIYIGSPAGVELAFDFIAENYHNIINNYGEEVLLNWLNDIGSRMTTESQVDKLENLIGLLSYVSDILTNTLRVNALASAKKNIEWIRKHEKIIVSFLDEQKLNDITSTTSTTFSTTLSTSSSIASSTTTVISTSETPPNMTSTTTSRMPTTTSTTTSRMPTTTSSTTSRTPTTTTSTTTSRMPTTTSTTTSRTPTTTTSTTTSRMPTTETSMTSLPTISTTTSKISSTTESITTSTGEPEPEPPVTEPDTSGNSSTNIPIPTLPITIFLAAILRFVSLTL